MNDKDRNYTFKKPPGWKVIVDPSCNYDFEIRNKRDSPTMIICIFSLGKHVETDMYSDRARVVSTFTDTYESVDILVEKEETLYGNSGDLYMEFSLQNGNKNSWEATYCFMMDGFGYQVSANCAMKYADELRKNMQWFMTTFKKRTI